MKNGGVVGILKGNWKGRPVFYGHLAFISEDR